MTRWGIFRGLGCVLRLLWDYSGNLLMSQFSLVQCTENSEYLILRISLICFSVLVCMCACCTHVDACEIKRLLFWSESGVKITRWGSVYFRCRDCITSGTPSISVKLDKVDQNLDVSLQHCKHCFLVAGLFMLISGSRQRLCVNACVPASCRSAQTGQTCTAVLVSSAPSGRNADLQWRVKVSVWEVQIRCNRAAC